MRKKGVDAGDGLPGILGVYFKFGLAIFFRDGEDTESRLSFERIGRLWVQHADAEIEEISAINESQHRQ